MSTLTSGGGQAGLQERRQRVDVGGHPGHDAAGQLALVVVEAEALQMREGLHPQRVEQPFAGAPGQPADRARLMHPVDEDDGERDGADRHQQCSSDLRGDAAVDAAADQRGDAAAARPRRSATSTRPASSRPRTGREQPAQAEVRVGGPGRSIRDVGLAGGRRQPADPARAAPGSRRRERPAPPPRSAVRRRWRRRDRLGGLGRRLPARARPPADALGALLARPRRACLGRRRRIEQQPVQRRAASLSSAAVPTSTTRPPSRTRPGRPAPGVERR